jgi:hypothetical protein
MKYLVFIIVASLFVNPVSAKSTRIGLNNDLELILDRSQARKLSNNTIYNYSAISSSESIGMIQKFRLSPRVSGGLGLWLGGLEIELETMATITQFEQNEVDLNRWLGVRANIDFADIIPYGSITYLYESRDRQFQFNANAGIKLLQPTDVSVTFVGEWGDIVEQQSNLVAQLERDTFDKLENYYLEPVLGLGLSYTFD